jgi:hypothetical protein
LLAGGNDVDSEFFLRELRNFLDDTGRLKGYPGKFRLKIISLFYLAEKFEKNRQYTEKQVNEVLRAWHTFEDWAMLRRELYDKRFFDRDKNGALYRLEEKAPTLAAFGLD